MLRAMDIWLPGYLRRRRIVPAGRPADVILCVCDHFEPFHRGVDEAVALERVGRWADAFPSVQAAGRDAGGHPPRHTFFYPVEQYHPAVVEALAEVCRAGAGEVEVHLHHRDDTAEGVREKLLRGRDELARHGLLCRDPSGGLRYGFIHGNWALDNAHPRGEACGVTGELGILAETGCYADFTLPAAPDRCQTRTVNSLYYARSDGRRPKAHDRGRPARAGAGSGPREEGELLIVQGPLGLNWRRRKWGVFPRLENGDLTGTNPPSAARFRLWLDLNVHLEGRPGWVFVKLHTHGAKPENGEALLGGPMHAFHRALRAEVAGGCVRLHYVTARELVNILHAAEDGREGDPGSYRDYRYVRP